MTAPGMAVGWGRGVSRKGRGEGEAIQAEASCGDPC